jgi:GTP cyclohydrolase I
MILFLRRMVDTIEHGAICCVYCGKLLRLYLPDQIVIGPSKIAQIVKLPGIRRTKHTKRTRRSVVPTCPSY